MSDPIADDVVAIREGVARLAKERAEVRVRAQEYWCQCGHPGRMVARNVDGHKVCSSCNKAVDE